MYIIKRTKSCLKYEEALADVRKIADVSNVEVVQKDFDNGGNPEIHVNVFTKNCNIHFIHHVGLKNFGDFINEVKAGLLDIMISEGL